MRSVLSPTAAADRDVQNSESRDREDRGDQQTTSLGTLRGGTQEREQIERIAAEGAGAFDRQMDRLAPADVERGPGAAQDCEQDQAAPDRIPSSSGQIVLRQTAAGG